MGTDKDKISLLNKQVEMYCATRENAVATKTLNSMIKFLEITQKEINDLSEDEWSSILNSGDISEAAFLNLKSCIRVFLKENGYENKIENISYQIQREYFLSLDDMMQYINGKMFQDDIVAKYCSINFSTPMFTATKYSCSIAYALMLWIGLSQSECEKVTRSDVDLSNNIISTENQEYNFSKFDFIVRYFNWWFKQEFVYLNERLLPLKGDNFLRSYKGNSSRTTLSDNLRKQFGLKSINISNSAIFSMAINEVPLEKQTQVGFSSYFRTLGISANIATARAKELMKLLEIK